MITLIGDRFDIARVVNIVLPHGVVGRSVVDSGWIADAIAHEGGDGEEPKPLFVPKNLHEVVHLTNVVSFLVGTRSENGRSK